MNVLLLIIVGAVTLLLYLKRVREKDYWRKVNRFKGLPTVPILGNVHQLGTDSKRVFYRIKEIWHELGHTTFKLHMGQDIMVFLTTPECIEVLVKHNTQITKPKEYTFLNRWIGDGLLTSTGAKWKRQRKIITPTFHLRVLETYVDVFNKYSNVFIKHLERKTGKVIDIFPLMARCSLDIICETSMGLKVNAQEDKESEYVQAVHEMCNIIIRRIFSSLKRIQWIFDLSNDGRKERKCLTYLHNLSNKVIKNRREEMREEIEAAFSSTAKDVLEHMGQEKKVRPFMDLLLLSQLPDGSPLDDATIRDEVDTFIFEGHDTTTSAISFTLYELSRNPDVQKQAVEEQLALLGADLSVDPTHADLVQMKYLEKVIKESLRLYPSVPMYGRGMTADLPLPDGNVIPAGVTASVYVFALHRHPKYYPDPEKFDPERFNEDKVRENPYMYLPFSAGLRNCIGQKFAVLEMKSVISKILRKFELKPAGPEYDAKLVGDITLKSTNGVNLILTERI